MNRLPAELVERVSSLALTACAVDSLRATSKTFQTSTDAVLKTLRLHIDVRDEYVPREEFAKLFYSVRIVHHLTRAYFPNARVVKIDTYTFPAHLILPPQLEVLDISNMRLTFMCIHLSRAVTPYIGFLQVLNVSHTQVSSLDDFASAANLRSLIASNCPHLMCIRAIQYMPGLDYVNVSGCTALHCIRSLSHLKKLTHLNLNFCSRIHDFSPLSTLTELRSLELCAVNLHSVDFCTTLAQLEDLDVAHNSDIETLQPLHTLHTLHTIAVTKCRSSLFMYEPWYKRATSTTLEYIRF